MLCWRPWPGRVSVAAVNGPAAVVVSGDEVAAGEAAGVFTARGWRVRRLRVSHGFHSPLMDPVLGGLGEVEAALAEVRKMRPGGARRALTGSWCGVPGCRGTGCGRRGSRFVLRRRWGRWRRRGCGCSSRSTPDPVLSAAVTEPPCPPRSGPGQPDGGHRDACAAAAAGGLGPRALVHALARAHVHGVEVDWAAVLGGGTVVDLPTYAFQRQRFWPRPVPAGAGDVAAAGLGAVSHPLLGAAVQVAGGGQLVLTGRVSAAAQPWLADHVVGGVVLVPGTALLELAVRAGDAAGCGQVTELALQAPLVLPADGAAQVQVVVDAADGAGNRGGLVVFPAGPRGGRPVDLPCPRAAEPGRAELRRRPQRHGGGGGVATSADAVPIDTGGWYEGLAGEGLGYGPAFRGLRGAWRRGDEVFAEAVLPEAAGDGARFGLHPALLDAVLHAVGLVTAVEADRRGGGGMLVPFAWSGVVLHAAGAGVLRARLRTGQGRALSVEAADSTGQPVSAGSGRCGR